MTRIHSVTRQARRLQPFISQVGGGAAANTSINNSIFAYNFGLQLFVPFAAISLSDAANSLRDYSTLGKHMRIGAGSTGHYEFVPGVATSIHFLGDAQAYIYRPDETDLHFSDQFSLGGWFKFGSPLSLINFFGRRGAAGNISYGLALLDTGELRFYVSADGTTTTHAATPAGAVVANQWYYIVGSFRASENMYLYVNNIRYRKTTGVPASVHAGTSDLQCGGNTANSQYCEMWAANIWVSASSAYEDLASIQYTQTRACFGV